MGNGTFEAGRLNFVVSANTALTAANRQTWQDLFTRTSDVFYRATGGQVSFGNIYMTDNDGALRAAEVRLFADNRLAGGTYGRYGDIGYSVTMPIGDIADARVFAHEFFHHLWNLCDEYTGPREYYNVDRTQASPDRRTIVLQSPIPNPPQPGEEVILLFAGKFDRKPISSINATTIVVASDFPDLPSNCQDFLLRIQRTIGMFCGAPDTPGAHHCLMGQFRTTQTVEDFCDASNHTFAINTEQQLTHGHSCWETIVARPGFTTLNISPGVPTGQPPTINFVTLAKEARFVLAIDRSGSMQGEQLAFAKESAKYWKDLSTLAGDRLSIIAFNSGRNVVLPLTAMASLANPAQLNADIDALLAGGQTNIRDALNEAVTQITSAPGRAELQAVVLLTDGKHNTPTGSRLTEAISALRSNGIFVSVVAIGDSSSIDVDDLDQLSIETGGTRAITDPLDPSDMERALIEANQQLRGQILSISLEDFAPAPPGDKHKKPLDDVYKRSTKPKLASVLAALGVTGLQPTARQRTALASHLRTQTFTVEPGCAALTVSMAHGFDCDIEIFLVDPSGREIIKRPSNNAGSETYEMLRLARPEPGTWRCHMVARRLSSRPISATLIVGVESRKLQVTGGVRTLSAGGSKTIEVHAHARYERPLTNLKVTAELSRGPTVDHITLHDGAMLTETCGDYTATFRNLKAGHYRGRIIVTGGKDSQWADLDHALNHSRAARFVTKSKAPAFHREIPFHFHVT